MATFEIQAPDGKKYRVEGDNAEGALAALQKMIGAPQPAQEGGFVAGVNNVVNQIGTGAFKGVAGLISAPSDPSTTPRHPVAGRAIPGAEKYVKGTIDPTNQSMPTYASATDFMQNTLGIPFAEPKTVTDRMLQAAGQGAGGGAAFGPVGALGGVIGGTASQTAAEAGAPPWAQTAIGIAAPILGGRFGTPKTKTPARTDLKAQADAAYAASRGAGLSVADTAMGRMAADIAAEAKKAGIDPTLHPKATAALGRIEQASGSQLSLDEIDTLRQIVGDARGSIDAGERRIGQIMAERLDDFLDNLRPGDVAAGDAPAAVAAITKARERWATMRKTETIEDALKVAQHRTAATGSGGNVNNAIRQEIRKILDNKKAVRPFSKEERELMERVVTGSPIENLLRLGGKLSPEGNGLMMALGLGATAANPMFALASGGGWAAKRAADAATRRNVEKLRDLVASGQVPTGSLTPTQQQMIDALKRAAGGGLSQVPQP